MTEGKRPPRVTNPIHIGGHHTVSGHEAMNLAKRLSEELATHNQSNQLDSDSPSSNLPRAMSPECGQISRSFEGKKGNLYETNFRYSISVQVF